MPKSKKPKETPEQQAARFRAEVERLIAAGELSPTKADAALDAFVEAQGALRPPKVGHGD